MVHIASERTYSSGWTSRSGPVRRARDSVRDRASDLAIIMVRKEDGDIDPYQDQREVSEGVGIGLAYPLGSVIHS